MVDYIGSLFPWRISPPLLSSVLQVLRLFQVYQDLYSDEIIFVSIQGIFSSCMACYPNQKKWILCNAYPTTWMFLSFVMLYSHFVDFIARFYWKNIIAIDIERH